MPTLTSRLGLSQPLSGDLVSAFQGTVTTSFANVDNNVLVTATAVSAAGAANTNPFATAATIAVGVRVTGDTNDRLAVAADGTQNWGPGNAATDIFLKRASTSVLDIGGSGAVLRVRAGIVVGTTADGTGASSLAAGGGQDLFLAYNSGSGLINFCGGGGAAVAAVSAAGVITGTNVGVSNSANPANVSCPHSATTTFITTSSLSIGTWFVWVGVLFAAVTTAAAMEIEAVVGTATATFAGQQSDQDLTLTTGPTSMGLAMIVTVTVAGTIIVQAKNGGALAANDTTALTATPGSSFPKATGYAATRIL